MKNSLLLFSFIFLGATGSLFAQEDSTDFYHVQTIQEIRIEFQEENWRYLLDSLRYNGDELLTASFVEIQGKKYPGVGVRIIDEHSFQPGSPRNGLLLKINHRDGGLDLGGHRIVQLSSSLRDPSMVREVFGYEVARKYMPAPKANYANVWVNNRRYGLYINVESVEGDFLKRHFHGKDGNLYYSHPQIGEKLPAGCSDKIFGTLQVDKSLECLKWNFEQLQGQNYKPLEDFIRTLNQEPEKLEEVLDVDRTLWMLAFNNVLVNLSSYSGKDSPKYFLYQDESGRFTPILWNLNLLFGGYKNTGVGSDLKMSDLQQLDPLLHSANDAKPLISKLLSNPIYRKMYLSHVRTLLYNELASGNYQKRIRELQDLIRPSFALDSNKVYSQADLDQSLNNTIGKVSKIPGIFEFAEFRVKSLKRNPEMLVVPPGFSELTVKSREQFSPKTVDDFRIRVRVGEYARKVQLFYRFSENSPFQVVAMSDDGTHEDEQAGDGIFGAIIKPQSGSRQLEYYLMAENAKLVSYSPERYMFEQHRINLDELNR